MPFLGGGEPVAVLVQHALDLSLGQVTGRGAMSEQPPPVEGLHLARLGGPHVGHHDVDVELWFQLTAGVMQERGRDHPIAFGLGPADTDLDGVVLDIAQRRVHGLMQRCLDDRPAVPIGRRPRDRHALGDTEGQVIAENHPRLRAVLDEPLGLGLGDEPLPIDLGATQKRGRQFRLDIGGLGRPGEVLGSPQHPLEV